MKSALKSHQTVTLSCCNGTSTNAYGVYGPHSTNVGVNSTRECNILFIYLKHSEKAVVLLFPVIEYQIRKILRVEVRRFQIFVMLGYRFRVISSALQTFPYGTPVFLETS